MNIVKDDTDQEPVKMPLPDLATMPNYFVIVVDKDRNMEIHTKGDGNLLAYGFADAVVNDGEANTFFKATIDHLQEMGRKAGIEAPRENPVKPVAEA